MTYKELLEKNARIRAERELKKAVVVQEAVEVKEDEGKRKKKKEVKKDIQENKDEPADIPSNRSYMVVDNTGINEEEKESSESSDNI